MQSAAEDRRIGQPQRSGRRVHALRRDDHASSADDAGAEHPDGAVVAADSLGRGDANHSQSRRDRGGRDAVREDRCEPVTRRFDVERAQRHQMVEGVAGRMGHVDAVGHGVSL